jgi:molybdate transport system permease protein
VASIAIYDHVEGMDYTSAHWLAGLLLLLSFLLLVLVFAINRHLRLVRT